MSSQVSIPPAETAPSDLASDLAAAQALAAEVRADLEAQRALFNAGIIDLDAGVALVRQRRAEPAAPELNAIIAGLRTSNPALFRAQIPSTAGRAIHSATLSPVTTPDPRADLARAAENARITGNPRSLTEYLRLRRASAD